MDQEGGRIEHAKRWNPVGYSISIAYRKRAAFGQAASVSADGLSAMKLFQSTYVLRPIGCISTILCKSEMEEWKT